MIQDHLECPSCGRIDLVQKVSSIVSAGTSSSTHRGHADGLGFTPNGPVGMNEYITVNSSSQTALSGLLSPPPQPTYFSPWSELSSGFVILLWFALIFCSFFVFENYYGLVYTSEYHGEYLSQLILWVSIFAFIGVIIYLMNRQKRRQAQSIRRWVEAETPRWQTAITIWQYLYYCHRCDGIYIPVEDSQLVPTAQMMDYLYSS